MAIILADLALIIVLARATGYLFTRIGQPAVVGEIAAGVLLGPSLLGDSVSEFLFPLDQRAFLSVLASIGLVLFMFIVGLELDVGLVRGRGRVAASVSVSSILLPFALGLGLAWLLFDEHNVDGRFWPFALFMGAAMSVTAFPVLARILTDRNMHRTETGGLALACAAVDDILAWTLLAVVIGLSGAGEEEHGWLIALAVPFAVFVLVVVRPQLERLTEWYQRSGRLTPNVLATVLIGLLVTAAATEYLGVHFIFGAFLFGAVMPRQNAAQLRHEILIRLEQISVLLLLPVFFLVSGLRVDISALSASQLGQLVLILTAAIIGKGAGAYIGARASGVRPWQARSLGILMNTRGLTELVILNVGREKGLIGDELFTMLVVMALVTTMMTGPLLRWAYPERRVARDIAEAERLALGAAATGYRVLVLTGEAELTTQRFALALGLVGHERPAEVVLSSIRPFGSDRLEVGSGLSEELAAMADAMTRLEQLVQTGERQGVKVTVLSRFSSDVEADLLTQVDAMAPAVVIVGADDAAVGALSERSGSKVATVLNPAAWTTPPGAIHVRWGGKPDHDAALLLAVRMASSIRATLVLDPSPDVSQRRVSALQNRMQRLGLDLQPTLPADVAVLRIGQPGDPDIDLAVAAEPDATPVDWATVEVPSAQPAEA